MEDSKPNYLKGAAILAAASVFVKIIGAIYKIPLFQDGVLGDEGTADFNVTYSVYTFILMISTAGVPAALSRLVSAAKAKDDNSLVKKYFSVAMPCFFLIGLIAMLTMFFFADGFARMMGNSMAATGIRVLSPAVFFVCIISVYRGYAQGFQNMLPTAISQIVEVLSKAIFGIAVALWLVRAGMEAHIVSAGAIVGVTIGLGLCIPLLFYYKKKLDRKIASETEVSYSSISGESADKDKGIEDSKESFSQVLGRIMKVSIPITLSASFMSIMVVIDNGIVLRRLQGGLGLTETAARGEFGIYSRVLSIYNLTPSLLVPISISIIPAIAAALAAKRTLEAKVIMQSSVKLVNLIAMPASAGLMVLSTPILTALYNDQRQTASTVLFILGIATTFVCVQYVTTAILQANGFEKISLITFPIGAGVRIALSWVLTANPDIGVLAPAISTAACFALITVLNILFICIKIKDNRPKFLRVFIAPAACSAVMAGIAYGVYQIFASLFSSSIGNGRVETILFLAAAIIVAIAAYGILVIVTRTVTMEDMKLVPKGEKLGKILRVKA